MNLTKRNVALWVLICILSCGIGTLFWLYNIAKDIKATINDEKVALDPWLVVLLSLATAGLFLAYYGYVVGTSMDNEFTANGISSGSVGNNRGIIYAVLPLLGLGIISIALIQTDLNTIADSKSETVIDAK